MKCTHHCLEFPPFATNFAGHLCKYVKQNQYQTNAAWANKYLPRKRQIAFNLHQQLLISIRFDEVLKGLTWLSKHVQVANTKTTKQVPSIVSPQGYSFATLPISAALNAFPIKTLGSYIEQGCYQQHLMNK